MEASLIVLFKLLLFVLLWVVLNWWIAIATMVGHLVLSCLIFRFILGLKPMDAWSSVLLYRDPGNSLIITSFVILDRVTLDDVVKIFEKLTALPGTESMRRRFISVLGNGYLVPEENFSVSKHISYYTKRPVHTRDQLVEIIGEEMMVPLPMHISGWEVLVVPDFDPERGRSALVYKIFHALCDGISMSSMMMKASSVEPVPYKQLPRFPWYWKVLPYVGFPLLVVYGALSMLVKGDRNIVTQSNGKPLSGIRLTSCAGPYPLQRIRDKCKLVGGVTINDFVGAAVVRAFRKYLEEMDPQRKIEGEDANIHLDVPFTYRDRDEKMTLSIKIGLKPTAFPLVSGENPREDIERIHDAMRGIKGSACMMMANVAVGWLEELIPSDLLFWAGQTWSEGSTSVFTNVPGTRNMLAFGDKRVHDVQFLSPNIGANLTAVGIFTYAEEMNMLLVSDKSRMERPDKYAKYFDESMTLYLNS